MFQFPGLVFVPAFSREGSPIRIPTVRGLCAPPRGFSQLAASFVTFRSLGIHCTPLFVFLTPCFAGLRAIRHVKELPHSKVLVDHPFQYGLM